MTSGWSSKPGSLMLEGRRDPAATLRDTGR